MPPIYPIILPPVFDVNVYAKVAQLVERNLAKVEVASSNLVFRSKFYPIHIGRTFSLKVFKKCFHWHIFALANELALVVKLVDTQDLKSCGQQWSCGFKSRLGHTLQALLCNGIARLFSYTIIKLSYKQ